MDKYTTIVILAIITVIMFVGCLVGYDVHMRYELLEMCVHQISDPVKCKMLIL